MKKCYAIFIVSFILLCLTAGCNTFEKINDLFGVKDDNVVEEAIEGIIKMETGADIDLTPRSPE